MSITDITVNNLSADIVDAQDDDGTREYTFPAYLLPECQKKLDQANTRLGKAGIDGSFDILQTKHFDSKRIVGGIELEDGTKMFGTEVTEPWVTVTINMVPLTLGDYTFVASLVPEQTGMTVHTAPGQNLDGWTRPDADDDHCDHCNTSRRRTRLYVIRNNETGELLQVGHSCLELFTGCTPKGLWVLGMDGELKTFSESDEGLGFSSGDYGVRVQDVLGMAFAFSDQGRNYVSRSAAEASWGHLEATGGLVRQALLYPPRRPFSSDPRAVEEWRRFVETMSQGYAYGQDEKLISDILAAAQALKPGTDYADNMAILVGCDRVSGRNVGILASLVAVYAREKELAVQRARAPKALDEYAAPVGTRVKTPTRMLLKTVKYWEGDYGTTTLLIGWDEAGHILKWKASGEKDYSTGDTLVLGAYTVKSHDEWNGQFQTVITRAKVDEVVPADEKADA